MLTLAVFEQGLRDINNTYPGKRFSVADDQNQFKQWYKLLKGLNDESYLNGVDEWCSSKSSVPSPADIIETANRIRSVDNTVHIPKNAVHCDICKDEGLVSGNYRDKQMDAVYEYVACCICEAGQYCHSIYQLPQIDPNKYKAPNPPSGGKMNINSAIKKLSEQMSL